MKETRLGKIKSVSFGYCGYQEAGFGISFDLGGDGWGVLDAKWFWATSSDGAKWTEADRTKEYADVMRYTKTLLDDAGVMNVNSLKGKPVEVVFDGNTLKSWRILKDVL